MQSLFTSFYLVIIIIYIILSIFIVFHLASYSVNKFVGYATILFFLFGTIILISINALQFSDIPFEKITLPATAPQKF